MQPALPVERISTRGAGAARAEREGTSGSRSGGAEAAARPPERSGRTADPAVTAGPNRPARATGSAKTAKKAARTAAGKREPSAGRGSASRSKTARDEGASAREHRVRRAAPASGNGSGRAGGGTAARAATLPVREGEDRWTPAELAGVRAALEEQIAALEAEIAAAASQIAEGDGSDGAGDDQADTGAKTYEREHELALTYNSRDLLAQAERAVQRIDAGTYGICESCGKPVGKARLQAFPRATLCVSCKQREERR